MNTGRMTGAIFRTGLIVLFLLVPALHPDGQIWIVAAASTAAIYWGSRASVVYSLLFLLIATEVIYGGDVGSVSGAFALTVGILTLIRRFITIQPWVAQDGWRVSDYIRTVVVSWVFSVCVLVLSIAIGDVLFGYDRVWARIMSLWTAPLLGTVLVACAVFSIVLRRMTIPFRRAILFGT